MSGRILSPERAHAARVALAASLLVCIVYAGCVTVLDKVISTRLITSVDTRLLDRLTDVQQSGVHGSVYDNDVDAPPVYLWRVTSHGPVAAADSGAPRLPRSMAVPYGSSWTVTLGGGSFRLSADRTAQGSFISGQSVAEQDHLIAELRDGEAFAAPVLLLAMFAGALTIGLRALSPVEESRRRQLEFTADASHELRTPLSVITAETTIALSAPRDAEGYRSALTRIAGESQRLRRIVEDMLWLARFDSAPPEPGAEPLDLATIASDCADRFRALAASKGFQIVVKTGGSGPAWISAPPEWIDRLAGVLADNACRFAGEGGTVRIGVAPRGNRVCLTVEDTGPGLPPESRERLFDRFHRSTDQGGSAGLGLAIADSIVQSTGGQWRVDASELGGALFEVSWRRASLRQHSSPAASWTRATTGPS
jgi:two-component system, OmpR family, sensor histidine kinase CiaH